MPPSLLYITHVLLPGKNQRAKNNNGMQDAEAVFFFSLFCSIVFCFFLFPTRRSAIMSAECVQREDPLILITCWGGRGKKYI